VAEMLTVVVEFDAKEVQEELKRIDARLDPNVLDPLVAKSALEEVRTNYQAQRDPDGNPWPQESREYLAEKAAKFGGKPMMHASERLWQSLGYTEEGDIGSISGPPYAVYANAEREFAGVGEAWLSRADVKLLEYVDIGEGLPL